MKKYIISAAFIVASGFAIAQPCNESLLASYNDPVCSGKDLQLTATSIAGATYGWQGPGGFASFVRNTTISNTTSLTAGDYIVTATIGSCIYKDTVNVTIRPLPAQPVITFVKPPCEGDSLLLTATSTSGTNIFHFWDPMGNPMTPTGNISSTNNGIYSCVTEDALGCLSDTGKLSVTVHPLPATPVVMLVKPACTGDTLLLSAQAPGSISSFLFFDKSGNSISSIVPAITFSHSGIYRCVAIGTTGCMSLKGELNVVVHQTVMPGVAIYSNAEVGPFAEITFTSYVSKAGAAPVYSWMRNGNPILNANGNTYKAISGINIMPGDVISLHVLADAPICPGTGISNGITVVTNLSVNDMDKEGGFVIYPNPSTGIINIKTNLTANYKVDVLNTIGSVVYTTNGNGNMKMDVSGKLPTGTYIIRMTSGNYTISRKVNIIQ